jgi:hypothetical protein
MKKLTIIFLLATVIGGCNSKKELSKEEASQIIKEGKLFPRVIDYDIYCSDPEFAKKVIDAGLEQQGLVTVQLTQKLGDVGKPLIAFTDKAKPYLLPTPEKDKRMDIQKVKIADEELIDVTGIQTMEDGKQAVAEYTTAYKNIGAFSALTKNFNSQTATHKAYFTLYDDGWRLEKK